VVKRISLMAQKNAPLRMKFEDGGLEVSAETPDIGEARESLPAPFKGETLEIGFNPEFLQDGLDSAESEELIFKLISPHRPGLIQSGDDGGFIYLVMPVRLNV
jgi:DNA polymerase-3 subunit beta